MTYAQKGSVKIQIVDDIQQDAEVDDMYAVALMILSVHKEVKVVQTTDTCRETMLHEEDGKLPPQYKKFCAAFSTGLKTLPAHAPHDLEIKLMDKKIPGLGPLYQMSEHKLEILQSTLMTCYQRA